MGLSGGSILTVGVQAVRARSATIALTDVRKTGNLFTGSSFYPNRRIQITADVSFNTNQYKDVIAQREFSASEARQRVKNIVVLRSSSLTQHRMR